MATPVSAVQRWCAPGLLEAIGVTRVARVTDLDQLGLEVACAVRPEGHVLQVSQGKGRDWPAAVRSAVHEAAELWAAECPDASTFTWASAAELRTHGEVWSPDLLASAAPNALWHADLPLPWVQAQRLDRRARVWVPAQSVYCAHPQVCDLGPLVTRWTSNGLGAHAVKARALQHALLEVYERHALALSLPFGWSVPELKKRRIEARGWAATQLERRGAQLTVFDVTPARTGLPPVAAALLRDSAGRSVSVTAGYACRLSIDEAVDAAVSEAAQSRLTDIHGAREDVSHDGPQREAFDALFEIRVNRRRPRARSFRRVPLVMPAASVTLSAPVRGLQVVKVIAPSALLSELL